MKGGEANHFVLSTIADTALQSWMLASLGVEWVPPLSQCKLRGISYVNIPLFCAECHSEIYTAILRYIQESAFSNMREEWDIRLQLLSYRNYRSSLCTSACDDGIYMMYGVASRVVTIVRGIAVRRLCHFASISRE